MNARFLLATALLTLSALPAHAGFTLITPEGSTQIDGGAAPQQSATGAIPPTTGQVVELSPVPAPMAQRATAPKAMPIAAAPMPSAKVMPVMAALPVHQEPLVRGFGKDMPLIIAAQQIAPADRQIAFGAGVDPSMPVTWRGGNAWKNVLSEALNSRGLKMAEQGNILFISQSKSDLGTQKASLLMTPKDEPQQMPMAPMAMQQPMPMAQPMPMPMMQPPQPMPAMAPPAMPTSDVVTLPTMTQPPVSQPMSMQQSMSQPMPMAQPVMMQQPAPMMAPPAPMPMNVAPAQTTITSVTQTTTSAAAPAQALPPIAAAPVAPPRAMALPEISQPAPASAMAVTAMPKTEMDAPKSDSVGPWRANTGRTLKQTLENWSQRANVTLRWDSEFDYPVQSNINIDGDYEAAVRGLLRGFSAAQPQPIARLYRPTAGAPGVLVVSTRGNDMSRGQ